MEKRYRQLDRLLNQISSRSNPTNYHDQYSFLSRKNKLSTHPIQFTFPQTQRAVKLPRISRRRSKQNTKQYEQIKKDLELLKVSLETEKRQKQLYDLIQRKLTQVQVNQPSSNSPTPLYPQHPMMNFPILYPFPPNHNYPIETCSCHNNPKRVLPTEAQHQNKQKEKKEQQMSRNIISQRSKTEPIESQHPSVLPKTRKRKLKFRVYAIAVFFTILFPHFSAKFTKNRFKLFKMAFITNSKLFSHEMSQIHKRMIKTIGIMDIIKTAQNNEKNQDKMINTLSKTKKNISSKQTITDERRNLKQSEKFISIIIRFTKEILRKVQELVTQTNFITENYLMFSLGTLNGSFLLDHLLLDFQLDLLKFHQEKGYMTISKQMEKGLIGNLLVIKLLISNTLLNSKKDWYKQQNGELSQYQWERIKQILYLSSCFLYIISREIFIEAVQVHKNTVSHNSFINSQTKCLYSHLKKKLKVKPSNPYKLSLNVNIEDIESSKLNLKSNYKSLSEKVISTFYKNEYHQVKEFIDGFKNLDQLAYILQKDPNINQVKKQFKKKINQIISIAYKKVKDYHRQYYDQIKTMTVEELYLIQNGIKKSKKRKPLENYRQSWRGTQNLYSKSIQLSSNNKNDSGFNSKISLDKSNYYEYTPINTKNRLPLNFVETKNNSQEYKYNPKLKISSRLQNYKQNQSNDISRIVKKRMMEQLKQRE